MIIETKGFLMRKLRDRDKALGLLEEAEAK